MVPLVRLVSVAAALGAVLFLMWRLPLDRLQPLLQSWLDQLGLLGPLVLAVLYAVATVLMVPGSVLTILGGALYGLLVGTAAVSVGSTLGAAAAFTLARLWGRRRVEAWIRRQRYLDAVDRAIAQGGWRVVVLLRLSPAVPFNVQNYLYGLTAIGFWPCILASWIAMLPGTLMYVYLGHLGTTALGLHQGVSFWQGVLLAAGLVATVAVTVYLTRLARRQLQQYMPSEAEGTAEAPRRGGDLRAAARWVAVAAVLWLAVLLVEHQRPRLLHWLEQAAMAADHRDSSSSATVQPWFRPSVPEERP